MYHNQNAYFSLKPYEFRNAEPIIRVINLTFSKIPYNCTCYSAYCKTSLIFTILWFMLFEPLIPCRLNSKQLTYYFNLF